MKNKLPNFLIVGAAKCGTSSMHNYLNQHPEVFMPSYNKYGMKVKEPRFLIKDLVQNRLHNGIWDFEEYKSLFSDVMGEKAIGESTVLYLYYYQHAIKKIKENLGKDVRIIIMLRSPVDRAYSAFQHVSRGFQESNSFEESLDIETANQKANDFITLQDIDKFDYFEFRNDTDLSFVGTVPQARLFYAIYKGKVRFCLLYTSDAADE